MKSLSSCAGLVSAIVILGFAAEANAASIRFCLKGPADFLDSELADPAHPRRLTDGSHEFYWNDPDVTQYLRGVYVKINRTGTPSTILWQGYTGDGVGTGTAACTGYFTVAIENGTSYDVEVRTYGLVQGNQISVDNVNGISASKIHVISRTIGLETYDIDSADTVLHRAYRVYNAAAFAIYRHAGGVYNASYPITFGTAQSNYINWNQTIELSNGTADRKSETVHELGHALADHAIGDFGQSGDSSLNDATCPSGTGTNHRIDTVEYNADSYVEGFAHFYAADVFNNHGSSACVFQYYATTHNGIPLCFGGFDTTSEPTIDCEADTSDLSTPVEHYTIGLSCTGTRPHFPKQFMETKCTPAANRGAEVDWLRVFWDMHSPPFSISFNSMISWINNAQYNVLQTTAFGKLDDESLSIGGPFDDAWFAASRGNGVDWP